MKLIKVWSFQLLRLSMILIQLLEAFEDFLSTFKTSPTANITHALGGMNIDEDDFSDDNDMMDDDELCLAGTAITHTLYIFPNSFLPLLHSATAPLYRVTAALFAKLLFA